jgi:hypothetical protein
VLIRRPGTTWRAPRPAAPDEATLRSLLEQTPGLLPTAAGGEPAVVSDFRIASAGPLDLLGVAPDGEILLVECGQRTGPGPHRSLGGTALAVASSLWRTPYEEFDRAFAARAGRPLTERLGGRPGKAVESTALRNAVASNLAEGRFRLVLAVDEVTDDVVHLVDYLEDVARPRLRVVALGFQRLAEEGIEILIPTLYRSGGRRTLAAETQVETAPPEEAVLSALETSCLSAGVEAVRRLVVFSRARGLEMRREPAEQPALTAVCDVGGHAVGLWSCYSDLKPTFVVNFEWLAPHMPLQRLARLANRLRSVPSVAERLAGLEEAGYRRRPALAVNAVLAQPGAADVITLALEEFLAALSPAAPPPPPPPAASWVPAPPPPPAPAPVPPV